MTEEWRQIAGFGGVYLVSSEGRVQSLHREVTKRNGQIQRVKGGILRPAVSGSGYLHVGLINPDGKQKNVQVHRAVAESFLVRQDGLDIVDHINGDKKDNRLANLRWVTPSQNATYRHKPKSSSGVVGVTMVPGRKTKPFKVERKVAGRAIFIGYFKTIEEATKARKEAIA